MPSLFVPALHLGVSSLQTWFVVVAQKRRERTKLDEYLKHEHPGQRDAGDKGLGA